jgi:hypothetical protein
MLEGDYKKFEAEGLHIFVRADNQTRICLLHEFLLAVTRNLALLDVDFESLFKYFVGSEEVNAFHKVK